MPTNLTQDQIAQLIAQYQQQGLGGAPINSGGQYLAPTGVQSNTDGGGVQSTLQGFTGADSGTLSPGDLYELYGLGGADAGQKKVQDGGAMDGASLLALALISGGTLAGLGAFGGMAAGAGADVAGVSGMDLAADGGANSIFGAAGAGGAGAGAAGYSSGAAAGLPDFATMAPSTAGAGLAPIGASAAPAVFNAAQDSQLASSQLGLTGADTSTLGLPNSVGGAGNVPMGSTGGLNLPGGITPQQIAQAAGAAGGTSAGSSSTSNPLGNLNLGSLIGVLGGAVDANNQSNASQQMLQYLQSRQAINDNMYAPGSPEFNYLWDQMSRNDAAAGRNSQYGPRSVDLASKIAQLKMNANTQMTTGIGNLYAAAINKGASADSGLFSQLGNLLGNGSSGSSLNLSQLIQSLSGGAGSSNGTNVPGTPYPTQGTYNPATNPADPNQDSNPAINGSVGDPNYVDYSQYQ